MKWPEQPVGELCKLVTSGGTPSTKRDEFYGGDIPWLRTQEVTFETIWDTEIKITEAGLEGSATKWIPENSVIVAMYGASAGRVAINKIALTTNQACCNLIVDQKKGDYRYVFYALRSRFGSLESLAKGAAQRNLNAGQVKLFPIPSPTIETQRRIADVLAAYDDLIENNRRRIQLLEESARLLYKEWFVHLRFPGHEHTKITNGLPEGWERKAIAEVCETVGGGTPSTKTPEYWDGDITWVVPSDVTKNDSLILLDTERKITASGLKASSARMVPPKTILMTSRASVGFFAVMDKPACTNQGFINIVPQEHDLRHYLLFNLMSRVSEIRSNAKGTTYPEISKGRFRSMDVVVPNRSLVRVFAHNVAPILHQVRTLKRANSGLAKARDLLLPRLMNGEIVV